MKAKEGFVLRHVVDEYILMPTGDNISKFNGTVLLNEVAAFVWDKLQNPVSKDDILEAMLNEYEVDRETATADLDALLAKLSGYGVIEED
ncbi:MAG: PqqD family protein [Lachnospiraceae bacterium]|nr:PqqD family protein [Lachnospiraceae bacterium]MBR7019612.1 PqqD family protein [Lachnospiraceae bacterium]